jgi:hypothetical protein
MNPRPTIDAVRCTPWCTYGDGHTNETCREDQTCWGPEHYVEASTEEVLTEYRKATDEDFVWPSRVGAQAYRGFNQRPQVYIHVDLPAYADGVDVSVKLTAEEAQQLAALLLEVAELINAKSP